MQLPWLDNRDKRRGSEERSQWLTSSLSSMQLLVGAAPFLLLQVLFLVYIAVAIFFLCMTVFVPEYYAYVNTCVRGEQNSTFIGRNVHSLAFNYAAIDGM